MKKIRPGVKALIVKDRKVLVVHEHIHRENHILDIADFPGGGIDFGEGLKEALVREVKEEVGLDVKVGKVVGAWDFVIEPNGHGDNKKVGAHIVCIGYQCEVIGEAKIDLSKNPAQEDIYDAKWYEVKELLNSNGKIFRHKSMIEAVKNLDII